MNLGSSCRSRGVGCALISLWMYQGRSTAPLTGLSWRRTVPGAACTACDGDAAAPPAVRLLATYPPIAARPMATMMRTATIKVLETDTRVNDALASTVFSPLGLFRPRVRTVDVRLGFRRWPP